MKRILLIILMIFLAVGVVCGAVPTTTNLGLLKPASDDEEADWVDWFDTMNDNMDLIDAAFEDPLAYGTDTITKSEFADEDWGDLSVSSNSVTIDEDVIDKANLKDEDWGDVNISSNVAQVQDLTIANESAGDILYFDGTNWIRLAKDVGKYLKSGATAVSWNTPTGSGDMLKATYDADEDGDIDVAAGGTEKSSWTLYCIPYLSGTTAFGEIPIGTAEYALTVNAGANGYDWTLLQTYDAGLLSLAGLTYASSSFIKVTATDTYAIRTLAEVKSDLDLEIGTDIQAFDNALTSISGLTYVSPSFIKLTANDTYAVRTIAEMKTDLSFMTDLVDDPDPDLGGEMDAGAHTIGFTLQTDTGTGEKTIDWKLGNKMKFTFGAGNVTFIFTAPTNPCTVMLTLVQDGVGSRTITWPATVKWPGGIAPTLTTTANARDKIALDWDGTQYDGMCSKDFK